MIQSLLRIGVACTLAAISSAPVLGQSSDEASDSDSKAGLELPGWSELEAQGATIGDIQVVTVDVFDLNDPKDNNALFRFANRLHIRSRPQIIRNQLLFYQGEQVSVRSIDETERILRGNTYLVDAKVTPQRYENGVVDLLVRTQDVWTLNPGISASRSGGKNAYSFYVQESNLFGFGKDLSIEYESDVDRSSSSVRYSDPHLFGTWNQLLLVHASNSDGSREEFELKRPFYSLQTRWAGGVGALDWDRIDKRYDLGELVDQYRHEQRSYAVYVGRSTQLRKGRVQRFTLGMAHSEDRFTADPTFPSPLALPTSTKRVYPFVGYEWLEDRYETSVNETQIGRTEDLYRGNYFQTILGWNSSAWGGDRNELLLGFSGGKALQSEDRRKTLLLGAAVGGRLEGGQWTDASFSTDIQGYWRISQRQQVFGSLRGIVTHELDPGRQVLLGGDFAGLTSGPPHNPAATTPLVFSEESLRGYPLRYQDGTAMALLNLEHRLFTDYYWFRLFRVGAAGFFDVGRTWGRSISGNESLGWLKDIGVGLRLGATRSAFGNVIHIDVAFPLDGDQSIDSVQFLVQTKGSF